MSTSCFPNVNRTVPDRQWTYQFVSAQGLCADGCPAVPDLSVQTADPTAASGDPPSVPSQLTPDRAIRRTCRRSARPACSMRTGAAAAGAAARTTKSPQGQGVAAAQPLSCSWVANAEWADHQRLELENDLIAA